MSARLHAAVPRAGALTLDIQALVVNLSAGAEMSIWLATLALNEHAYDVAESLLARTRTLLQPAGNDLLLSPLHEHYATLELGRGASERAAEYAQKSLRLSERAISSLLPSADLQAREIAMGASSGATQRSTRMPLLYSESASGRFHAEGTPRNTV